MKNLIFVSMLVLLASSSHASPRSSNITSTILFDQEFVLAEGFDLDTIEYRPSTWSGFLFEVRQRSESMWRSPVERLKTKGGSRRSSFAMDTFKRNSGDRTSDKDFCKTHSNSTMGLLDYCEGRIAIRMLTTEEKRRIEQLKSELTRSKKLFKLVYNRKFVTIASMEKIDDFTFELSHKETFTGHSRLVINTHGAGGRRYMKIRAKNSLFPDGAFTIEGLPYGSDVKCRESEVPEMSPEECDGSLKLRHFDSHEDAV